MRYDDHDHIKHKNIRISYKRRDNNIHIVWLVVETKRYEQSCRLHYENMIFPDNRQNSSTKRCLMKVFLKTKREGEMTNP